MPLERLDGEDWRADQFWDQLIQGSTAAVSGADPLDVETIRHLHAFDDRPGPSRTFAKQLRKELLQTRALPVSSDPTMPLPSNGRTNQIPRVILGGSSGLSPARKQPHLWALAGIAAVLLLAAGLGYYLLGPGRSENDHRNTIPAAVAPATPVPPTPTPAAIEETLVNVEIPAEVLPKGSAGASLVHFTIPAGAQTTWTVYQNALLNYIWQGTLTVRFDKSMQVQRAGANGVWESIPSDTEVVLGPGDAVLMLDVTTASFSNLGSIPVEVVDWGMSTDPTQSSPAPLEWIPNDYSILSGAPGLDGIALPGGPATLRLRRVVLDSDASLPAPAIDVFQLVVAVPDNGAGTPVVPVLIRPPTGKTEIYGKDSTSVYVSTFEIAGGAGTPIIATRVP